MENLRKAKVVIDALMLNKTILINDVKANINDIKDLVVRILLGNLVVSFFVAGEVLEISAN